MFQVIKNLKFSEKLYLLIWLTLPIFFLILAFNPGINNQINTVFNQVPEFIGMLSILIFGFFGWVSMLFVGNDFLEILSKYYAWNKKEEKKWNFRIWGVWFSLISISSLWFMLNTH